MIANLDALGVPYTTPTIRAYSGGHSTYIDDPHENMIELVQHPLGLKDSMGKLVTAREGHESVVGDFGLYAWQGVGCPRRGGGQLRESDGD